MSSENKAVYNFEALCIYICAWSYVILLAAYNYSACILLKNMLLMNIHSFFQLE
jgi:hypothetical protein